MILDENANIGEALDIILKQRVAQTLYDVVKNVVEGKNASLTRAANSTHINIPLIATSDIPRDQIMEVAKAAEIKIALDIRKYLALSIGESGPKDVKWENVLKTLPITIINKSKTHTGNSLVDFTRSLGAKVVNDVPQENIELHLETSMSLQLKAAEFSRYGKTRTYSEANQNEVIYQNRAALPTQLEVELKYVSKKGEGGTGEIKTINYYMTVECSPRYVDDVELMTRFSAYDNRRFFNRFVQLERGEISFLADWALDLKLLMQQAKMAAEGNKNLLNTVDKLNLLQDMGVNVYPFLSILVSKDFVDKLARNEHMDLKKDADKIMKKFCALAIFIYNPNNDLIDIYFDGDPSFRTCTFADLGKDVSKYEKELKQLIKLNK